MAVIKRRPAAKVISTLDKLQSSVTAAELLQDAAARGIRIRPLDVEAVIRALGLKIRRRPMEDDISGQLSKAEDGWFVIVNSLHHPRRQRFTLAHEIAHYILHSGDQEKFIDKTFFRSGAVSSMEREANVFAAELLMPAAEFKQFVREDSKKIEDIAEHFDVSALAVRVRAKELGYRGHGLE